MHTKAKKTLKAINQRLQMSELTDYNQNREHIIINQFNSSFL